MLDSHTPYTLHSNQNGGYTIIINDSGVLCHTKHEGYGDITPDYSDATKSAIQESIKTDLKSQTPFSRFKNELNTSRPSFTTALVVFLLNWFVFSFLIVPIGLSIPLAGEQWSAVFVLSTDHPLYVWTWITNIFSHGGAVHLFVNCIVLLSFGYVVEDEIGLVKTAGVFFIGAFVGSMSQLVLATLFYEGTFSMLGASGGASALLAVAAVLYKEMRVGLFFIIPMKIRTAVGLFLVGSIGAVLYGGIGAFGFGHIAHLGGLFIGLGYALYYIQRNQVTQKLIKFN